MQIAVDDEHGTDVDHACFIVDVHSRLTLSLAAISYVFVCLRGCCSRVRYVNLGLHGLVILTIVFNLKVELNELF